MSWYLVKHRGNFTNFAFTLNSKVNINPFIQSEAGEHAKENRYLHTRSNWTRCQEVTQK